MVTRWEASSQCDLTWVYHPLCYLPCAAFTLKKIPADLVYCTDFTKRESYGQLYFSLSAKPISTSDFPCNPSWAKWGFINFLEHSGALAMSMYMGQLSHCWDKLPDTHKVYSVYCLRGLNAWFAVPRNIITAQGPGKAKLLSSWKQLEEWYLPRQTQIYPEMCFTNPHSNSQANPAGS